MDPGTILGGRFRLLEPAGRGGMGEVWRARDLAAGADVALKLTLGGEAPGGRFERESSLLSRVRHPALVGHVAHGTDGGVPWLAMEWITGETLEARLAKEPLSTSDSIVVARRIAAALGALHAAGIVHRDVKPSNVMLPQGKPEEAVLLDLGIARSDAATRALTGTNLVIGTLGYMAPEQARMGSDVDPRADVFSLGCVLLECLTGEAAYAGDNPIAVLAAVLTGAPPRARARRQDLSAELDDVVSAMCAYVREHRPRDGAACRALLDGIDTADAGATPARRASAALSHAEQRLALALLVELGGAEADAETLAADVPNADLAKLEQLVSAFGGSLVPLGANRALVVAREGGTLADRAAIAAAVSRAIVQAVPEARVAIAAGLGTAAQRLPAGEVLERAALLAREATRGSVVVDPMTAELLSERFAIEGGVLGEPRSDVTARRVLGRVVPFVGREKELAMLEAIAAEAIDEQAPRAALVLAAPGVGKSRLSIELASRLRARTDMRLIVAHAEAATAGATHAILRMAIRAAAGLSADSRDHTVVRAYVRTLAAEEPERLADFLGELAGAPREDEPGPELVSARGDVELMARWARRSVREWLAAECTSAPLVLLLEDLHWADEATLLHLGDALRTLRRAPLVVIALARPEVVELLAEPWPNVSELRLSGLGPRAAERLVRALLGPEADARVIDRIVERADGNPLFLEELARFVADGRSDELPASVLAVLDARLSELDPDLRWALRAASVLGERLNAAGVAAVAGASSERAESALAALVRAEVLERLQEESAFAFRHALVRDAAYATLPEQEARAAHGRAAEWLERAGRPSPHAMIHHLERAGERDKLVPWITEAAWESSEAGADREAFRLAERALALGASGIDEGRLALLSALRAFVEDDYVEAARTSAIARARLPTTHAQWLLATGIGACAAVLRANVGELQPIMGAWLGAQVRVTHGRLAYLAGYAGVTPLSAFGQREMASRVLSAVEAPRRSDTADAAWYGAMRASHAFFTGRMGDSLASSTRGRDVAIRSEDRLATAFLNQWVVLVRDTFVSSPRAVADVAAGVERLRTLGFAHATEFVVLLHCQARAGSDDTALAELAAQAHGGAPGLRAAFAAVYYVSVLLARGRATEAAEALAALKAPLSVGFAKGSAAMLAARVDLAQGRAAAALERLDHPECASPASSCAWYREWCDVTRIAASIELGRDDAAREETARALGRYVASMAAASAEDRAYIESEVEPVIALLAHASRFGLRLPPP